MSKQNKQNLLDTEFLGKPLREWNDSWKLLPGGFRTKRPELRHQVGLARAMLGDQIMYILRATEHGRGGIEKGLQRIRGRDQTGNAGYGARMIRTHMDDLDLEVLILGADSRAAQATKDLKIAMLKLHDPEWNRPHSRKMKSLRANRKS